METTPTTQRNNGVAVNNSIPAAPQPAHLMVMSPQDLIARVRHIQQVKEAVMKKDVHFGKPFGESAKDSLWKPGAEVLFVTFGLAPRFIEQDLSTADEYRVAYTCEVFTIGSETYIASGVGEASSNELKYKWRASVADEEYETTPENMRRIHYKKSKDGHFKVKQIRVDAADVRNTIKKMAKKRAYVDAALTATGASDMFEQDIEDLMENGVDVEVGNSNDTKLFYIKDVREEEKKKRDGTGIFTKYIIVTKDGNEFQTLRKNFAELARQLKTSGEPCTIAYKEGQYGKDIEEMEKAKAPKPPSQATSPAPTSAPIIHHDEPKTFDQKVGIAIQAFSNTFKVTLSQLESYLDLPRPLWDEDALAKLRRVMEKLTSGERMQSDFFG